MTVRTDEAGVPMRRDPGSGGLVGAEQRTGSDPAGPLSPLVEPCLGGPLTAAATVLFAGAHPVSVMAHALPGRQVTALVRRAPDAEALAADPRLAGASVLCGAAGAGSGAYDLVVALAGAEGVTTPDGAAQDWAGAVAALAARVAPGGALVLAARNAFGLTRVNAIGPGTGRTDAYEVSHEALERALHATGMAVAAGFAVYPDLPRARLVIHRDLLDDLSARDLAGRLVATACAGGDAPPAVATDPLRLARDAVRHGMAYAAAPGWVVVARRSGPSQQSVPVVAVSSGDGADPFVTDRTGMTGPVLADNPTLGWRPLRRVPAGPLLSEEIIEACGRHDLAAVRTLLTRYAIWLGVPGDGDRDLVPWATALPSAVVDVGTELWPLAPDADPAGPARPVFLRGMVEVAARLQSAGLPHPWSPTLTPARLAVRFASMAGLTVTDAEVVAAGGGTVQPGPDGPAGTLARPGGYVEAVRLASATARELAEARAQLRFLADTLAERDRKLRQLTAVWTVLRFARHPVMTVRSWSVRRARRS
jgi:hypothetical protein